MGCFSFLCKECGEPVNSSSFHGEHVTLYLLVDGKVVGEMSGQYDSYGRVFDKEGNSIEWSVDWGTIVDLMFNGSGNDGITAVHTDCNVGNTPKIRSDADPNQGWGKIAHSKHGDVTHILNRGTMIENVVRKTK